MRKLLPLAGAVAALLLVAAPALAGDGGLSPVTPNSPNARGINESYWLITAFAGAIFVLVEGLLVVFVVRYRRRRRPRDTDGPQIHGSTRLETMWTVGPVLVLAAIAAFVFVKLPGIANVPSASAAGKRIDVTVTARQFYWQFTYPNGAVSIDRLRAPVGVPVRLTVTAPDWDVAHSWWVPALGGMIDAIPGRTNHTWFTAERTGVYVGRCSLLCGIQHTAMLAQVEVMPRSAFDQWLAQRAQEQQTGNDARTLGQEEWVGTCAKCHGLAGQGLVGPAIGASPILQDRASLASLLAQGRNRPGYQPMPPVGRGWSQQQLDALSGYLKGRFGSGG